MSQLVLIFITIFLLIFTPIAKNQELEISYLNHRPLLILEKRPCKIQTGTINVIHPINLTDIEMTIDGLTNIAYSKTNSQLSNIMQHKIRELYGNFLQIKPHRSKRWDAVGTTWKWIGGSPDAQDLHIINNTLNNLIDENNQQIKINTQLGKRIQDVTRTINKLIENTNSNNLIWNEVELITAIINVETVNNILEKIQETVTLAKASIPSSKILSSREIYLMKDILEKQGVQIDIPDQALSFMTPKVALGKNTLLYILGVPKLQKTEATILEIHPLTNNDSIINDYPKYVIKDHKNLYTTSQPDNYVQRDEFIKPFVDDCIHPIVMGTDSQCPMITDRRTLATLIADNTLLIINAKDDELLSDCGPANRKLKGNFLITFHNCELRFKMEVFESQKVTAKQPLFQGAMHNLVIKQRLIPTHNITILDSRSLENRELLNHVNLKQFNHDIWNWSLLSGITLSTTLSVTLTLFALLYFRQEIQRILTKLSRKKNKKQPNAETQITPQENPETTRIRNPQEISNA